MEQNKCLECGEVLRGRADKKFCNDQCRNSYHNRNRSRLTTTGRKINKVLKENFLVLRQWVPEDSGKITVHKNELLKEGFNFDYYTHTYVTQKGSTYYFCYEYGYLPLSENRYLLVKREPVL